MKTTTHPDQDEDIGTLTEIDILDDIDQDSEDRAWAERWFNRSTHEVMDFSSNDLN